MVLAGGVRYIYLSNVSLVSLRIAIRKFIPSENIQQNESLASFDVVSLFTTVPTELALSFTKERLEEGTTLQDRTTLTIDDILELLKSIRVHLGPGSCCSLLAYASSHHFNNFLHM